MPRCLHWRSSPCENVWYEGDGWKYRYNLGQEHINDPLTGTHRDRTYHEPVPLFFKNWNIFYSYFLFSLFSSTSPVHPAAPRSTVKLSWRLFCSPRAWMQPTSLLSPWFLLLGVEGKGKTWGKVPAVGRYQRLTFHSASWTPWKAPTAV